MDSRMNMTRDRSFLIERHPCFNNKFKASGRMHLPVSPSCNIKCAFCDPGVDVCYHGCRPGKAYGILTPEQALAKVDMAVSIDPHFLVVGVAGPGEPLLAKETMETFRLVKEKYPGLLLCVSTNGLLLEREVEKMEGLIDTLTVTVNALSVPVARKIYEHIGGKKTDEAYQAFLDGQWRGVEKAVKLGITVKINTVYVKGRNDQEIEQIAIKANEYGCVIHNILPVIPNDNIKPEEIPTLGDTERMIYLCQRHLPELTTCQRCRADALMLSDGSVRTCDYLK